jgi:16S rRNA (guanine527-N7)-methyltransferase
MPADSKANPLEDRAIALELMRLSPKAVERLIVYEALLRKWQTIDNLVAPASLDRIWTRHFADSAQLLDLLPIARRWADLGSGAGFPGLVLAILLADKPDATVHLVESNQRKCAFLREVSRETSARAVIHAGRIENIVPQLDDIQAITARALAPLGMLATYAEPLLKKGAVGLFLKGQSVADELTELSRSDTFNVTLTASKTDRSGRIVIVRPKPPSFSDISGAERAR